MTGEGYGLTIDEQAEEKKNELLKRASAITAVSDRDQAAGAQFEIRLLADMRNHVERSRKEVKKPVLEIGRKIDEMAKDFAADVMKEESRLVKLVGDFAAEVERRRREAEAEERRKFEEAARAKREAEEAARRAEEDSSIKTAIAAKQAARERMKMEAARMKQSEVVTRERTPDGVKFVDDFEVEDIDALYRAHPECVRLTPLTSQIKMLIRESREAGSPEIPGIRIFQKSKVSTR